MKIRIAISLIAGGAVAFACSGPHTRSEASSSPIPTATVVTAQLVSNPARARHVDSASGAATNAAHAAIDTKFTVDVEPATVRFALDVTNATRKHLEVNFRNGQTYDFVVVDTVGRVLWRWSANRLFTQAVQNKQLGKGETMHLEESWTHPPRIGKFVAIAVLNSSNYPVQRKVGFEIPAASASLASR